MRAADIDGVAVQRIITGDRPAKVTRAERLEAVKQLHAAGRTYDEMAAATGKSPRQVHHDLVDLGLIGGCDD